MLEDPHVDNFDLPEAFLVAFAAAHGSDARMNIVEQFFERQEITLGQDGTFELKPNEPHQAYLIGSTSLIHVERPAPAGTLYVVQPVQRKRGPTDKRVLEDKIVSQIKAGRKLWLLTRKVAARSPADAPLPAPPCESARSTHDDESHAALSAIHPNEIVPEVSAVSLAAAAAASAAEELDTKAFGQLRTMLQNVRLQFWNGNVRSQATEAINVAAEKAEEHDLTGAIQAIEMLENVFVRLIEHWEHDYQEAERKVKRGRGEPGDPAKFKTFKGHHLEMKSRIAQTKTKFRIMLNWLREAESKLKRSAPGS